MARLDRIERGVQFSAGRGRRVARHGVRARAARRMPLPAVPVPAPVVSRPPPLRFRRAAGPPLPGRRSGHPDPVVVAVPRRSRLHGRIAPDRPTAAGAGTGPAPDEGGASAGAEQSQAAPVPPAAPTAPAETPPSAPRTPVPGRPRLRVVAVGAPGVAHGGTGGRRPVPASGRPASGPAPTPAPAPAPVPTAVAPGPAPLRRRVRESTRLHDLAQHPGGGQEPPPVHLDPAQPERPGDRPERHVLQIGFVNAGARDNFMSSGSEDGAAAGPWPSSSTCSGRSRRSSTPSGGSASPPPPVPSGGPRRIRCRWVRSRWIRWCRWIRWWLVTAVVAATEAVRPHSARRHPSPAARAPRRPRPPRRDRRPTRRPPQRPDPRPPSARPVSPEDDIPEDDDPDLDESAPPSARNCWYGSWGRRWSRRFPHGSSSSAGSTSRRGAGPRVPGPALEEPTSLPAPALRKPAQTAPGPFPLGFTP